MDNLSEENQNQIESQNQKHTFLGGDNKKFYQKKRIIVPLAFSVIFILFGLYTSVYPLFYQKTDDAYVDAHITTIASSLAGPVVVLNVDDNQYVKKGDLLAVVDPADYILNVQKAKARIAETQAALQLQFNDVDKAQFYLSETNQNLIALKSKLDFAQKDFERYSIMFKEKISSKQQFDAAKKNLDIAQVDYNRGIDQYKTADNILKSANTKVEATKTTLKRLVAELAQAELYLSWTNLKASQDGKISSLKIRKGDYAQVAQPLMQIVPHNVYVIANYKETQLTNIKPGQHVDIKIDTYPHKTFNGKVDSIQQSSGAKTSLFPPENAVGSYVKVVQRIPVKIVFTEDYSAFNIVPGMSVVPRVKLK